MTIVMKRNIIPSSPLSFILLLLFQTVFVSQTSFAFLPISSFPTTTFVTTVSSSSTSSVKSPLGQFVSSPSSRRRRRRRRRHSSKNDDADNDGVVKKDAITTTIVDDDSITNEQMETNARYIQGLLDNLTNALDKWIINGSPATRMRAYNIMKQIERETLQQNNELNQRAKRMMTRAGMSLEEPPSLPPRKTTTTTPVVYDFEEEERHRTLRERRDWERRREEEEGGGGDGIANGDVGEGVEENVKGRSVLSTRSRASSVSSKAEEYMTSYKSVMDVAKFAEEKQSLQQTLQPPSPPSQQTTPSEEDLLTAATIKASSLTALAGSSQHFTPANLGIGGLDDVVSQIKRRIWVPLAAPPSLLEELGIRPVRGLLLYGKPGCGKTLLARSLGKILSPIRPLTIVSGPEIMDKFVGSSEANLRNLFEHPPDLHEPYRDDEALSKTALHVIVLDEFDAVARTRGGRGGTGDQGDAGVARDSVVNQLLAKMDGVDPLCVPTLVIGLTNKRTLIEPALLRPGRFEVQIEVPPPRSVEQRVSILKVHMQRMFDTGRILVRDAGVNTPAGGKLMKMGNDHIPTYDQLLNLLAVECDGMTGASLAGVCRAAASHALERAVCDFASSGDAGHNDGSGSTLLEDCLVTQQDFEKAIEDVFESSREGDFSEEEEEEEVKETQRKNGKDVEKKDDSMNDVEQQ